MSGDTRRTRSRNKNAGGRNSSDGDAKRNGVDVVMKNGKSRQLLESNLGSSKGTYVSV